MRVAVIGGGKMGAWFARYFRSRGEEVVISDIRAEQARIVSETMGAERAKSNVEAVKDADMALVSVPIAVTPSTILEVVPHMKERGILAEVSSVKMRSVEALRQIPRGRLQPLSIHPLFGPAAESLNHQTIAVVPVFDGSSEARLVRELFDCANSRTRPHSGFHFILDLLFEPCLRPSSERRRPDLVEEAFWNHIRGAAGLSRKCCERGS